eukprot:jgi/Tetstr1/457562/TSEL_044131.t2
MAATFLPEGVTRAAAAGDMAEVRSYLTDGGDVNLRSLFQSQLLHIAAREGQHDVVRLLLDSGADVNALDYAGMRRTALHWACQQGHVRVVEELVDAGANTKVWCSLELVQQAQGKAWSMLVQGQRCGKMIDTEAPYSQSPAALCKNDTLRLALERPAWAQDVHPQFPLRFRRAAALLLLMSSGAARPAAAGGNEAELQQAPGDGCQHGADCAGGAGAARCPQEPARECAWQLPRDVVLSILPLMAYPISSWIQDGDFDPPESILK